MSSFTLPVIVLDPTDMEDFEIGAWLMAILAFPGERDLRQAAAEALCAGCVRATIAADPDTASIAGKPTLSTPRSPRAKKIAACARCRTG